MGLKLNTSSGGSVSIEPTNTASNYTLTVPAQTGTVVASDASGNVGIGTSSPWSQVSSYGASGATTQYLGFKSADGGDIRFGKASGVNNTCILGTWTGNSVLFYTDSTERMRISSGGDLLLNTTSFTGAGDTFRWSTGGLQLSRNANGDQIAFFTASAFSGKISTSGTTTTYGTSSDYRLKENIAPMTGALDTVSALKPVTYTWKADGSVGQGFIAHELQAIVPDCVVGEKDAVDAEGKADYQSIDTSFLVATLAAAIQELKAVVDAQAERITALENK